ncbi:DNA integrity scanning protein DisA nucleotide-binding domain protein [Candidatus Pacearchaeota archaeon]|nr:DNA integrity scanning protein DisA nucleotide-binding domain protein [Candidatus Pacearchaeota archaeon]
MFKKNSKDNILKELEETLIEVGLKIAKRGEGALFVVGDVKYRPLINQKIPPFNVVKNPKLLESLSLMDGAVIIDKKGFLKAYGVMIKTTKTIKNFGTRHSAAMTASLRKGNFVLIVSEEDKKLKVMREGKMVMQIDPLQKNVEKSVSGAVDVLESVGAGTLGTIGTGILVPALGIALLPGIVVFGSAYYLGRLLTKKK